MPEQEYKLIFSKNLKHYLDLNNKSQQDLVKDLGLSASTVSNWYTGLKLPRMSKVEMLANYFGINKSDLLEDKDVNKLSNTSIENCYSIVNTEENDITLNDNGTFKSVSPISTNE